ncbi:ATP12-domain-containing protein [Pholiota conissans]|uniref:ATP12-domain-containing protein n=1 Tax=Pholiota conissans TaxID=109636 RepID=A0A9P5YZ76_9AGAR|nr:ATP12-domain-containing protein [Pholiota conissans]
MLAEQFGRQLFSARIRSCRPTSQKLIFSLSVRWQSNATHDGAPVTDTNRAEITQKRFWKDVGIQQRGDSLVVTLDDRALKTPSGKVLQLPLTKSLPASLIAAEWDHQETVLKPHALPMTSIVSRAVDAMNDEATRRQVREALVKYIHTDTICFFHNNPEPLERLQSEHWTPLLDWARKTYEIEINVSNSILSIRQPAETEKKLLKVMESFDLWQMAALERATYSSKSFIIALAVVTNHLTVEEAALAASVEVNSQIERWGEVEDTHDVDYHDIRRQLGSAASVLSTV